MNGIFGDSGGNSEELGPPNFNGGMDMMGMLKSILPLIQANKQDDRAYEERLHTRNRNEQLNQMPRQGMLNNIGNDVTNPPKNNNVMLPPTYNGMSAYENEKVKLADRELNQKRFLGEEGLDVKREGLQNTRGIAEGKLDLAKDLGQQKVDISKQRADIYKFKAEHPNVQIIRTKGGNIQIYDPATRNTHDTGIDSGTLSDQDEIELRGQVTRENADNANQNSLGQIAARIKGQKEIVDKNNAAAQERQNTKPYTYEGGFIRNPKDTTTDYNPERTLPPAKNKVLPTTILNKEATAPLAPKGWKYVPKAGGGWTAVEDKGGGK